MARPLLGDPRRIEEIAETLKALGHPLRLRIVALLSERDQHVNALAERLEVAPAIVSQQLRILRMQGLVAAEHVDGRAVYRIEETRLFHLLDCMESSRPCERPRTARRP